MQFPKAEMIVLGNGMTLEVFQAGGGGLPVLLAHGWPEHAYSWRHQIEPLAKAGYHVIVPNQRGYGHSSRPEDVEAYDCHALTGDFNQLLDALGLEKAVFVGHDWGALLVWHQLTLNPRRALGAANLSVPFLPRPEEDPVTLWERALGSDFYIVHFNRQPGVAATAFARNARRFLTNLYRTGHWLDEQDSPPAGMSFVDSPGKKPPRGSWAPSRPTPSIIELAERDFHRGELMMSEDDLQVFLDAFAVSGFHAPCNWYRNFTRNWETTAGVEQKVTHPCLMIYGQHDLVPQADMSGHVQDLETHTLDCGHWIQQEKPEETNRILLDWLERRMRPLAEEQGLA